MNITEEKIIKLLEKNKYKYISGEKIAQELNITRSAVWKTIKALNQKGYDIESKQNSGYKFQTQNNKISKEAIEIYLDTKTFGKNIHIYDELDSTNQKAKELLALGCQDGTLIIADTQTQGKGRKGRNFYSPKGTGIYMSLIVKNNSSHIDVIKLTTMSALAICKTLEKYNLSPKIKWVNDVYLEGKKLSGILTEATTNLEDYTIEAAIVGIGINYSTGAFPEEISDIAISLKEKIDISRNQMIGEVISQLEKIWEEEKEKPHIKEYKKRLLMLGKKIQVISATETYEAQAIDLDDEGALIIKTKDNEIKTINSGEISIKGDTNE